MCKLTFHSQLPSAGKSPLQQREVASHGELSHSLFSLMLFFVQQWLFFQVFIGLSFNSLFYIQTNCFCTPPIIFALSEPHPCIIGSNVFCQISWKVSGICDFPFPQFMKLAHRIYLSVTAKEEDFYGSIHPSERTFCYCRVMEMVRGPPDRPGSIYVPCADSLFAYWKSRDWTCNLIR